MNIIRSASRNQKNDRVIVLGTGMFALTLANEIESRPECGITVVGLVSAHENSIVHSVKFPLLGEIKDLAQIIQQHKPVRVIDTLDGDAATNYCHGLVEEKFFRHIQVDDGEDFYEELTGKLAIDTLSHRSLMLSKNFNVPVHAQYLSRALSLLIAVVGIMLTAPLMLLIAILIKLDSRGPVLFVQNRVGLANKTFKLLKFRTMRPVDGKTSEWVCDNTDRITRVGRVLRKFRLDELPQFFNVLFNDMNIVGPRPHPASNYELYALVSRNTPENGEQIPYYHLRSMVRPGITGWAQVKYRYANNLAEEIEKLRFDLYYIKHYSLWLDARIMFETIKVVVLGHEQRY